MDFLDYHQSHDQTLVYREQGYKQIEVKWNTLQQSSHEIIELKHMDLYMHI